MRRTVRIFLPLLLSSALCACLPAQASGPENEAPSAVTKTGQTTEALVLGFDSDADLSLVAGSNASVELRDGSLRVALASGSNLYAGIVIEPDAPWDWSEHEQFGIAMDMANSGDEPFQVFVNITDASGTVSTRSVVLPARSAGAQTYYAELKGEGVATDTGLRDDPSNWIYDGEKLIWMWGQKEQDVSAISQIGINIRSLRGDRTFTLDNLRLVVSPETDAEYLTSIVDRYGQNAKTEFVGKTHSDAELLSTRDAELATLSGEQLPGRSRFNGWADGPKLDATGYFRTEKYDGKWSLVDPEGYLFFSNGIANVRMSNTSTMTGRDYPRDSLVQRSADDLTPEDSLGLNPAPARALPERFISHELRYNMFEWLPGADDPLADHYGYRREIHTGPFEHGETYSFYRANLERRYGEAAPESYLDNWRDVTLDRMTDWGFTSFGNWIDPMFYDNEQVPYFANGWIIGDFKTVSSGNDFWAPMPDPFDPLFRERARITVKTISEEVQGSPWAVGVFIDNEKSWGRMGTAEGQYGIVINTLSRSDADSPTKAVFTRMLREKYDSIDALNAAWSTDIASWDALSDGVTITDHSEVKQADYAPLLEAYAEEYFRIVSEAVKEYMPNHMYMGARFASWGMTPEVRAAASRHVDVMSYNSYREVPPFKSWSFLEEIDMPSIIGEFHMGAISDTGLFHPGLVHAVDQADRARMYKNYMETVVDNDYFVGAHWFQYIDSPLTGRAIDGENYNVGFVNVTDTPYATIVDAARDVNSTLYTRRYGNP